MYPVKQAQPPTGALVLEEETGQEKTVVFRNGRCIEFRQTDPEDPDGRDDIVMIQTKHIAALRRWLDEQALNA